MADGKMKSKIYYRSESLREKIKYKYGKAMTGSVRLYPGRNIGELHNIQRANGMIWDKVAERWKSDIATALQEVELRWPQPSFPAWTYAERDYEDA